MENSLYILLLRYSPLCLISLVSPVIIYEHGDLCASHREHTWMFCRKKCKIFNLCMKVIKKCPVHVLCVQSAICSVWYICMYCKFCVEFCDGIGAKVYSLGLLPKQEKIWIQYEEVDNFYLDQDNFPMFGKILFFSYYLYESLSLDNISYV